MGIRKEISTTKFKGQRTVRNIFLKEKRVQNRTLRNTSTNIALPRVRTITPASVFYSVNLKQG